MTKVLSLYLPQFHSIKENDMWWGKGFTEWNVVRAAKKISKLTNQPRIPTMGYYDLSDVNSIRKQVELAKSYRVDGFVIYSYYSNGQLLLDKPAELLLNNSDIDIEFCFSWANHDWMRTWFSYNKELLRRQKYAETERQVEEHFRYLLPFFLDRRYIKIDNKPVFFVYDPDSIPNIDLYMKVFNYLAVVAGFNGVFFVQTLGGHHLLRDTERFDAFFEFEPTYTTFSQMQVQHSINRIKRGIKKIAKANILVNIFDYRKVCDLMEKRNCIDKTYILGSFAEWDNTPRHSHNGTVFKNFSIERFKQNVTVQLEKATKVNAPFIVIDAWNEWGEGAFLEPDEIFGFQKLEAIRDSVNSVNSKHLAESNKRD